MSGFPKVTQVAWQGGGDGASLGCLLWDRDTRDGQGGWRKGSWGAEALGSIEFIYNMPFPCEGLRSLAVWAAASLEYSARSCPLAILEQYKKMPSVFREPGLLAAAYPWDRDKAKDLSCSA